MNKKNIKIYKIFFHILKEEHLLKEYLTALKLYNFHHNFFFDNFKEWLKFIDSSKCYLYEDVDENDVDELIYNAELFCDWYSGDNVFEMLGNNEITSWQDAIDFITEKLDYIYTLNKKRNEN